MTTSHDQLVAHYGDTIDNRDTGAWDEPSTPPPWQWGAAIAAAMAAALVPWTAWLSFSLPPTALAYHWSVAWTGLDAAIAGCGITSAVLLRRRNQQASLSLVATATLMLTDSWFDVCTAAPGRDVALAVAEAVLAELPLAAAALWLAGRLHEPARSRHPHQGPHQPQPPRGPGE